MKTKKDVDDVEGLIARLSGLYSETLLLSKKSPNDPVNKFKLSIINEVILSANTILGKDYQPLKDFTVFNIDDVPTNSDVTLVLALYSEQAERFRSANVTYYDYAWVYVLNGKASDITAAAPTVPGAKR